MKFYTNVQLVGDDFLVRGYDNGNYFQTREKFSPTLFMKSPKKSKYKTLSGETVSPIKPGSVMECRSFIEKYSAVENVSIYGNDKYIYQYISDTYPQEEIKFDVSKVRIFTIDIEVASENGFPTTDAVAEEILAITIQNYATKQIVSWGQGAFVNKKDNVSYINCNSEVHLLRSFLAFWTKNYPDVITGWNCNLYDIPYICGRIDRVLGQKEMRTFSPWNMVRKGEVKIMGREHVSYNVSGIACLDYLDLYKKFTYKAQESYRLDYIAEVELGKKKLDHSEYDTFKDFYTKGWQKFIEYNIIDVELVDELEDKMKLIELALTMAYDAKVNYIDVFYQVRMWDTIIYNYLKKKDIVIPPKDRSEKNERYAGAYVKEPKPGVYDWVASFDLNSLYPHLMMQYNISPETLIDERHPKATVERVLNKEVDFSDKTQYAVCANGAMYRKDKRGFLPELMDVMYEDRKIYKKKMLKSKQQLVDIEEEMKRRGI